MMDRPQTLPAALSAVGGSPGPVLVAEDLVMSYRGWTALRGLSFTLRSGRIMGFLGPNGAGKTTSIRILTTILRATSGRFWVDGVPGDRPARIRPLIGVLPEVLGLPNQITGIEYVTYFAKLYGWTGVDARQHALDLLSLVGLRERAGSLIRMYSHGMRQRVGIARALVNEPVVLFLDEPTVGLDPRGKQELLRLLEDIARHRGAAIVLSSHALSEVEEICDDAVILSAGTVVASGTVTEILEQAAATSSARPPTIQVHVPLDRMREAAEVLRRTPEVVRVTEGGVGRALDVELIRGDDVDHRPAASDRALAALVDAGVHVLAYEVAGSRLEDAFIELTEGDHGDAR
jgi:ABC-2 type transport system ATP-binding protein